MINRDWTKVDLLRHVRHDWLNKLQLIKGNLDLNKIDRTKEIISEIVIQAQNETKLSNLNFPNLTLLLLTHNWEPHSFQIEFEVLNHMKCNELDDQMVTEWIRQFFLQLDDALKPFGENHLSLTLEPQEQGIRFFFDFCGTIEKTEMIQTFIEKQSPGVYIQQGEIGDEEFSLEVLFQQDT
ncbi:Spo0B C-terminal domain-containing protein [Niallia sp. XMNu-256]|uniref:Spo0B C-terminal domain-containing protein n=1 Tax=Niallia sp. XMNu-256 TaxID=3082444 RepID=UPI0030CB0B78